MRTILKVIFLSLVCIDLSAQLTLDDISFPSQMKEGEYQTYMVNKSED